MFKKIRGYLRKFFGSSDLKKCRTCLGTGKVPIHDFYREMTHWPAVVVGHTIPKKDCPDCGGRRY